MGQPDAVIVDTYQSDGSVFCDPSRLGQLLSNLVSNAVTHGDRGKPIQVELVESSGSIALRVSNSASRIPDAVRNSIFEPFSRSDYSQSRDGLGLGLFICKEIAEGHKGRLSVHSDDDLTVFQFDMPKASVAAVAQ